MGKQDGEMNEMNVVPEEQENGRLKPPLPNKITTFSTGRGDFPRP